MARVFPHGPRGGVAQRLKCRAAALRPRSTENLVSSGELLERSKNGSVKLYTFRKHPSIDAPIHHETDFASDANL